jgi:hypothetical protein
MAPNASAAETPAELQKVSETAQDVPEKAPPSGRIEWHERLLKLCGDSNATLLTHAEYAKKLVDDGYEVSQRQVKTRMQNFQKKGLVKAQSAKAENGSAAGIMKADKLVVTMKKPTGPVNLKRRVPNFFQEFLMSPQYQMLSEGMGSEVLRKSLAGLRSGYECSKDHLLDSMSQFAMDNPQAFSMMRMMMGGKRYGTPVNAQYALGRLEQGRSAPKIGDILGFSDLPGIHHSYGRTRSMFVNSPPMPTDSPMELSFGTTHLGVGFCDLSLLATAKITGESTEPLHFVGIDTCDYVIARTLLIKQMLMNENISVEQILEVWYSSTWSTETWTESRVGAWTDALEAAITDAQGLRNCDAILNYVRTWKKTTADWSQFVREDQMKKPGEKGWFEFSLARDPECATFEIGSFLDKRDRIAACFYGVAGRVFADKECVPLCGNPTWWSVPGRTPLVHEPQTIFDILPVERVLEAKKQDRSRDVVEAITACLLQDVKKLKDLVMNGRITMNILNMEASLDPNFVTLATLWAPTTVSWSNVVDYMRPTEFHKVAEAISTFLGTRVRHYAYSMNFNREVHGFNLLDYDRVADRRTILQQITNPAKADPVHQHNILQPMWDSGLPELCLFPPETMVHNLVEYGMSRRFASRWLQWFYGLAPAATRLAVKPVSNLTHLTKTGNGNYGGYGCPFYFAWQYGK